MRNRSTVRMVPPSTLTWIAVGATLVTIAACAAFLIVCYSSLPDILPVRFNRVNRPIGWQFKTYARVLMPALVQTSLALIFGGVGTLILSRSHGVGEEQAPDIVAAAAAAEAIALVAFVWIAFQGYAAGALVEMWQRGRAGGDWYSAFTVAGIVWSLVVGFRAHKRLGRPGPREFVAEHWRYGHLYRNPSDPALFVPTRNGLRWTLNFGRPVAAALLGLVLAVGIVGPTVILGLLLRWG